MIDDQYINAKRLFPNLIKKSQFNFSIQFDDDPKSFFEIAFSPPNYQNQAPRVVNNTVMIDLPILRIWTRLFTLSDLLEQIKVYYMSYNFTVDSNSGESNEGKKFQHFSITKSEVHDFFVNAPQEQKQTEDGLNVMLASITPLSDAQKAAVDSRKQTKEEMPKVFNTTFEVFNKAENLENLVMKKMNLSIDLAIKLTKEQRSDELKTKLYFIQQENEKIEAELQCLLRSLHGQHKEGDGSYMENIIKIRNHKKQLIINSKLINYHQQLIDSLQDN